MSLTVRKCLEISAWKAVKVVAGEQGLSRKVSFVNIMEVPEVVRWMKGGELLLTAGYAFSDNPELRKELIYSLAKKGIAGLGVKPGKYWPQIPADIIETADKVDLPILELPEDLPYMELMLPVFEIMINHQLYQLKRAEDIHNRLLEVILSGGGFLKLCKALSELVGNPVFLLGKSGEYLAGFPDHGFEGCCDHTKYLLENWQEAQEHYARLGANRVHPVELIVGDQPQALVLVPIGLNAGINGFLVVVECNKKMDEHDVRAVEYAGTIASLVFAKEKAVFDAERQIKGELLEDLISGNFQSEEVIIRRAAFLNFNIKKPLAVFILDIDGFEQYFIKVARRDEGLVQALKEEVLQVCHSAFFDYPGAAMLQAKSDGIVGLVPVTNLGDQKLLAKKCHQIIEQIKKRHNLWISIGVGRVYSGISNIKKSHGEAEMALKVGRHLHGGACVSFFQDLGSYCFLYQLKGSDAVRSFQSDLVEKIKFYDAENNTSLYETLVCYFKNDRNFRLTAEKMFVHRNSIIYRIRKIEEITGLSLKDPEDCFNLQLSLKLDTILK